MAKYQVVQGFVVDGKEYPSTIDESDVPDVSLLVASGRVVLIDSSTSKADKAGDK